MQKQPSPQFAQSPKIPSSIKRLICQHSDLRIPHISFVLLEQDRSCSFPPHSSFSSFMNPFHLNPPSYFPLLEGDHEDLSSSLTFNSTSSYSVQYINIYPQKENMDQVEDDYAGDQDKEEGDPMFSPTMSSEDELFSPTSLPTPNYQTNINNFNSFKPLIHEGGDRNANKQCSNESVKWMSSKMRLMKKMMISSSDQTVTNSSITRKEQPSYIRPRSPLHHDHDYEPSNNNSPNNKIRVCSDCNTTKTPLWRSGPQGPKSLCNACGIRQRKAKRAMAAAAANGGLQLAATNTSKNKAIKEKNTQYKKRCKLGAPRSKKKIQFDELKISLSKSSAFHQVFPQDEKEAAILLMALSCGLVH